VLARQDAGAKAPDLVAVVGRWSEPTIDGERVVRVEPSDGQAQAPAAIDAAATRLFKQTDRTFTANAAAPGAFSLAVLSNVPQFSGGTYSARFKLVSGASDQTAGLVFNLRPNGEYTYVRFNTKDGNVALWRYANGAREVIAHGTEHKPLPLGAWHQLAVTVTGTKVSGRVVGTTLTVEHDLKSPVSGRIGFWTKRDSETLFKDIAVAPAKP